MTRKEFEAAFHAAIKNGLTKAQQGHVMGELRALLDQQEAQREARHADVNASLHENHERVYGYREGE